MASEKGVQTAPLETHLPPPVYLVWTAWPDGSRADDTVWRTFTGQTLDAITRDGWLGAIHPHDRTYTRQTWTDALASTVPFAIVCRVQRADQLYRRLLVRGMPMLAADGTAHEWVLTATEVAARRQGGDARTVAHQLRAILETMADAVIVFDRDGHILQMNAVARSLLDRDPSTRFPDLPVAEQMRFLRMRDADGLPMPEERLISWGNRTLAGEVLTGRDRLDLTVRAPDGRDVVLSISGAPVRDARGEIIGSVQTLRDVTEQQQMARRTREALAALVAMAEMLVAVDPSTPDAAQRSDRASHRVPVAAPADSVARRLAELMARVSGCRRLGIIAETPGDDGMLVVNAGLTAREERRLREYQRENGTRLVSWLPPPLLARLARGESIPVDHAQPAFAQVTAPFRARSVLLTPMRLGGRLVGYIVLDYGSVEHTFTPDELTLAAGAAQLAALVLQREQLLLEREQARANELALRETNRRMDDFLAVAEHELRAPVMTTLLAVEQAQRSAQSLSDRTPAHEDGATVALVELQRHLGHADDSVERLRRLIADLLDLSRTRVGQLDVRPEPADLAAIVSEAVARQQALDPTRTISLHLPTTTPVPVMVDAVRIGQVLTNYVSNALKYSPYYRPVEVGLRVQRAWARVSVRDGGPGLSGGEQRRIWERYHQVPGICANAGTSVGLGLGLYLSREIVTAHGGRFGVHSAPGEGSTFWFTLPLDHTRT